ncbi:ABC transporter substrate-binding protein [Tumebacillus flagellatus]|uniref:ABC transporter substrate-binding protein n=1 Tax=Tumebacillus flagellatus TaxID=1157490 RepID=A0A074LS81_9BACL|nr:ABC transporter substrate-binding protein [Tumebacillus flagellatus]KEO83979.1 hypothetical protein EL26_07280 [Tumebacillus flagellatus]
MKAAEHYLNLRKAWPWLREGEAASLTLDEIAGVLDCTRQNARLVLRQMSDAGWVTWMAGRGRGNVSSLTFWQTSEQLLLNLALSAAGRGDAAEAFERAAELGPARQREVVAALSRQLGFRQERLSEAERPRDVLRTFLYAGYGALDPVRVYYAKETNMVTQIFDTLVRREGDGRIVPHLVHGWESREEGRVWTLYLRKGVTFHHGREMTADDVVFSLERLRGAESLYGRVFGELFVVRARGRYVVEAELRTADALFLPMLAAPAASIVPREFAEVPVGTGPFFMKKSDERQFVLEAHEGYFLGRPFLDAYETWIVPPEQVKFVDWSQLDVSIYRTEEETAELQGWREKPLEKAMVQYLTLRIKNEPLRRAVCAALDVEEMVAELGGSREKARYGLWRCSNPSEGVEQGEENQGMTTVSVPSKVEPVQGEPPNRPLRLLTFRRAENRADARWIQARCERAGIPVELEFVGGREFLEPGRLDGADMILKADMIDEHVEYCFYRALLGDRSVLPQPPLPWIADALDEARRQPDPQTRAALLTALDQRLQTEAHLKILYHERYTAAYQPHVQGITAAGTGLIDLRSLWFRER